MIKVGDICIWQNGVGEWAYLNGTETTVTGPLMPRPMEVAPFHAEMRLGWATDTPSPNYPGKFVAAEPGDLRKKFPDADDEDLVEDKELETT